MATLYRKLWDLGSTRIVVDSLEIANSFWKRSVGLLGRRGLAPNSGLWIAPCNSIHTLGMLFTIDVVFLNELGEVTKIVPYLKPWRIAGPYRNASVVLELPAGAIEASGIVVGARLMVNSAPAPSFPKT